MAIRKNKKRIDPRYFLNETTHRDLDEGLGDTAWSFLKDAVAGKKIEIGGHPKGMPGLWIFLYDENGKRQPNLLDDNTTDLLAQQLNDRGNEAVVDELRGVAAEVINKLHNRDGTRSSQTDAPGGIPAGGPVREGGYFTTNMPDDIPTTAQLMKKMRGEPDEEPSPFSTTGPDPQAALTTDDLFKLFNAGMNPADLRDVNNSNLTPEMKSILGRPS